MQCHLKFICSVSGIEDRGEFQGTLQKELPNVNFFKESLAMLKNSTRRNFSSHKDLLFGNKGRAALARGVDMLAGNDSYSR